MQKRLMRVRLFQILFGCLLTLLVILLFAPTSRKCMKRASISSDFPIMAAVQLIVPSDLNTGLFQQSTATHTATWTPTLTASQTINATQTITSTITPSPSISPTTSATTPTPTSTLSVTQTPNVTATGTSTPPIIATPDFAATETAYAFPQVTGTQEIVPGTPNATVTATWVPFPTLNLRLPSATPTPKLLYLEQDSTGSSLAKGNQPLLKRLIRFWPLVLIAGLWGLLGGWFLLIQWLDKRGD